MVRRFHKVARVIVGICLMLLSLAIVLVPTAHEEESLCPKGNQPVLHAGLQKVLRDSIDSGMRSYRPEKTVGAIVDVYSGKLLAMHGVDKKGALISNQELNMPYEPGSVMKPLVIAAAYNHRSIDEGFRYYDEGYVNVGTKMIRNVRDFGEADRSVQDVLSLSLNTGAVAVLSQLGKDDLGLSTRKVWFDYMTNVYGLGSDRSGMALAGEQTVPKPLGAPNIRERYAQTAYGIGITMSPLELMGAYRVIVGDGSYRELLACMAASPRKHSSRVREDVVMTMRRHLQSAFRTNNPEFTTAYTIGGKSGTAPIAQKNGTYEADKDSGTYIGYIGTSEPELLILIRMTQPNTDLYASRAAGNTWLALVHDIEAKKLLE